ncbi:uncharacterized protein LOC114283759 [Camellia sinensis]|uniref:uncharacterized protein LOC114283759 n=1 Tax=Camellia sinensis TaxID=4442 RepID=UPI0010369239|nr:uncharacterized protein LOC114283759 [Camellia sinensis]
MGANNNIHLLEEEKAPGDHYDHHDDHNNSYGQNEEEEDHSSDSNWADEDDDDDDDDDDEEDDHDHESNNSNESQERALYWESQESLLQEIVEHHRSTGGKLRKEINGLIEKARETNICKCVNPKSDGWCSRCLRQRVVTMLCCRGLHATLCTSKWTHTPKFPGGTHEYIEVTASTQSRKKQVIFLIELEFRDEFKMGKACNEYHHLIKQLPEIYIGKAEHLNAIVRVVCDAAKRSTMEKKIHMGPWRKTSFMQKKWSASSSSSPSRQAHIPICFAVEVV